NVKISGVFNFGSPSFRLLVEIKNTSQYGTITNIGFFIKTVRKPTWGSKVDHPGELTRPGTYTFRASDLEIQTRDFKVISSFGFMTGTESSVSSTFLKGSVGGGIPPGGATRFSIAGDGFLGDVSIPQVELGTILRFQGIGAGDLTDIALFPDLDLLVSNLDQIYQISKTNK
ncbi:MAG: hypothetical protein ABJB61_11215, partial [bacterium]